MFQKLWRFLFGSSDFDLKRALADAYKNDPPESGNLPPFVERHS